MNEVDRWRINHMLAAAQEALLFAQDETKSSLERDRKLQLALAMEITIIGESASRLSEELRAKYSELQWHLIVGMRNVLVHAGCSLGSHPDRPTQSDQPVGTPDRAGKQP